MTDSDIMVKALNALALLNTAIKNFRMYPASSASVVTSIDKLHQAFLDMLVKEEPIVFAESEKALLICGRPLRQADQEKPHALSLLNTLLGFGLKSISFGRGLSKEELTHFIDLISRKPESINNDGGLPKLMTDQNIPHIYLDQKVYVAIDKDHQIFSSSDITDDQITRFFMLTHPDMDPNSPQFREMSQDPEALSRAFDAGLAKIMTQKGTLTNIQIADNLSNLLSLLNKTSGSLDDENRSILSQHVGRALFAADPVIAEQLTTQNMEHLLGGFLLQYLMAELNQGKPGVAGFGDNEDTRGETVVSDESKRKLLEVTEKFSLRLRDAKALLDEELMSVLPKIIEQLIIQKEQEAMENLLERLAANLTSEKEDVRASAARSLADIIEHLPNEQKNEIIKRLSGALIEWLKNENIFSPDYNKICIILKNATQDYIRQRIFPEALKYLDAFNAVAHEVNGQPDAAKKASVEMIDQLACPENIKILLTEIDLPDKQKQDDAGRVFSALGNPAITDLLDQLRASADSDERVRIMHLISSAKEKAQPLIIEKITKEAPWFYLRNLAYLLGQIGNEESARVLAPLLSHENDKLRQEVIKSIHRIGGTQRGHLLLAALPHADDEFKSSIVEALGQAKAAEAVPVLIDLIKNKPLIASAARTNLEEKICMALGAIGSPDAIEPLSEITEAKSFLRLRAYPDKVKAAAARSLTTLRRKIAESGPDTV